MHMHVCTHTYVYIRAISIPAVFLSKTPNLDRWLLSTYMSFCTSICMYAFISTWTLCSRHLIRIYACMLQCTRCAFMYVCVCLYVYACLCTYSRLNVWEYMYIYTYTFLLRAWNLGTNVLDKRKYALMCALIYAHSLRSSFDALHACLVEMFHTHVYIVNHFVCMYVCVSLRSS